MASLMHMRDTQIHVLFLNGQTICIKQGYLGTLKVHKLLHIHMLLGDKVADFVTNFIHGNCSIEEPFRELLLECERTFIKQKYECLLNISKNVVNNVNDNCPSHGKNSQCLNGHKVVEQMMCIEEEYNFKRRKKKLKNIGVIMFIWRVLRYGHRVLLIISKLLLNNQRLSTKKSVQRIHWWQRRSMRSKSSLDLV